MGAGTLRAGYILDFTQAADFGLGPDTRSNSTFFHAELQMHTKARTSAQPIQSLLNSAERRKGRSAYFAGPVAHVQRLEPRPRQIAEDYFARDFDPGVELVIGSAQFRRTNGEDDAMADPA